MYLLSTLLLRPDGYTAMLFSNITLLLRPEGYTAMLVQKHEQGTVGLRGPTVSCDHVLEDKRPTGRVPIGFGLYQSPNPPPPRR